MKKRLIIITINVLFLAAFLVCHIVSASIILPLYAGYAGRVWAGESDERFAQLAAFFPLSYEFNEERMYSVRKSLDNALLAVSLEASDERKLYTDAWSAEGEVSVTGQRGKANASAIGVGGDFFLFHPLFLRNGGYITPNDIMRDRVVLDEELAWRLYGSVQLAGLRVQISGKPFVIAGVVSREGNFAYEKAYDGGAGLYMSYEALREISGGAAKISNYEIVMPDLVTDFALSSLTAAFDDKSIHIVDNTARFGYGNLFSIIGKVGERSMQTTPVALPYWENANRYAEDWLALLLAVSIVLIICPVTSGVILLIKLTRYGIRQLKRAARYLWQKREARLYRRYMKMQEMLE